MTPLHLSPLSPLRAGSVTRLVAATGVTILAATGLVACASGTGGASPSGSTTTMTATPEDKAAPTSTVTETGAPHDDAVLAALDKSNTSGKQQEPAGEWDLEIAEIRSGDHNGYDRVVIEFTGSGTPGWYTGYVDEPRQQASGLPVEMAGESFLEVNVPGLAMPLEPTEDLMEVGVVKGAGDNGTVSDIYFGGIFEAQGQFIIGLDGKQRPYQVSVLENPTRLVVDIED